MFHSRYVLVMQGRNAELKKSMQVLTKYRRVDPTRPIYPCFGINSVPSSNGRLFVGDRVRVARYAVGKLPEKEEQRRQ